MSFLPIGLPKQSSRRAAAMPLLTTSVSQLVSRCLFGVKKGGSTLTTRAAGFNGIAAITPGAGYAGKMPGKSDDGKR